METSGEKRWIGNGSKASMLVALARAELNGKDRHIEMIVEPGMVGFEVAERYEPTGLRGNDLRHLHFRDVQILPETCSASRAIGGSASRAASQPPTGVDFVLSDCRRG